MHKKCEKDNVETDICINGVKDLSYLIKKNFMRTCYFLKLFGWEKMLDLLSGMVYVILTGWNLWGSKAVDH